MHKTFAANASSPFPRRHIRGQALTKVQKCILAQWVIQQIRYKGENQHEIYCSKRTQGQYVFARTQQKEQSNLKTHTIFVIACKLFIAKYCFTWTILRCWLYKACSFSPRWNVQGPSAKNDASKNSFRLLEFKNLLMVR